MKLSTIMTTEKGVENYRWFIGILLTIVGILNGIDQYQKIEIKDDIKSLQADVSSIRITSIQNNTLMRMTFKRVWGYEYSFNDKPKCKELLVMRNACN